MFCPSNETLQNITEKTKLLAQKCTQQIRVSSDQQTSGSGGATEGGQQDSTGKVPPSPAKESGGSKSLRCLCPCKGTLSKIIAKKVGAVTGKEQPRSTTRWYVKVIQMASWELILISFGVHCCNVHQILTLPLFILCDV